MRKGFDKLRGVAAASAMSLGLIGAGSARAANTALPLTNLTRGTAVWKTIQNQSPLFSGTAASILTSATASAFNYSPTTSLSNTFAAFAIADVSASNFAEAFDNALHLAVNGTLFVNPDATIDLTGDTITADSQTLAGVETEIQFYFHPTRPIVRAMYSFTNSSSSSISIQALVAGAFSSDDSTTIQATSTGDTTGLIKVPEIDDSKDFWRVTNDQSNIGTNSDTDPAITLTRFGEGAAVKPVTVLTPGDDSAGTGDLDNFGERYDLTIAADETARIIVFAEINKTISDATSCAVDFASLDAAFTAGMLNGLSIAELGEIVNYGDLGAVTAPTTTCVKVENAAPVDPPDNKDDDDDDDDDLSTGTLSLTGLTTLLSLLTLVRVRQNKKA